MMTTLKKQLAASALAACNILVGTMMFTSCSEDTIADGIVSSSEYFKINDNTIVIGSYDTSGLFAIVADCGWEISVSGTNGWNDLYATPDKGEGNGTVTINTSVNTTSEDRQGVMTIKTSDGLTRTLKVVQQAGEVYLRVAPNDPAEGKSGGRTDIAVTCNKEWTVTGGTDWCTAEKTNDMMFTIVTDVNTTNNVRTATFTVTAGDKTETVTLTQSNKDIILAASPGNTLFRSMAATQKQVKTLAIVCNDAWTAEYDNDWMHLSQMTGKSDDVSVSNVSLTCDDNTTGITRTGTIVLTCKGIEGLFTDTIRVTQNKEDIVFDVSATEMYFRNDNRRPKELLVVSNAPWLATTDQNWVQVDNTAAIPGTLSETVVNVQCMPNNTGVTRTATLTFHCNDMVQTVNLTQDADETVHYLEVTPTALPQFLPEGGEQRVRVDTDVAVLVFGQTSWCHLQMEGNEVVIIVDANGQGQPRMTNISFVSEELAPVNIVVMQGYYTLDPQPVPDMLNVAIRDLNFNAGGGSYIMDIQTNTEWTAITSAPWVELSSERGVGNAMMTVVCLPNTTRDVRTATVTIQAGERTAVVNITQNGNEEQLPEPQPVYDVPAVTMPQVTNAYIDHASLSASYSSELPVTEYGFVYATHPLPTTDDVVVRFTGNSQTGTMSTELNGLTREQTYYVRAYAINSQGTGYSEQQQFIVEGREPENGDNGSPVPARRK